MKLPNPVELNPAANSVMGYTDAQMLQFRRDALEEAAALIDSRKTGANQLMDSVREMDARVVRSLKEGV